MRRNYYSPALILGTLLLLSACAKEGPTGPTGPAGPGYTGAISGHVSLYDQYGSKVLTNLNAVQLVLTSSTAVISAATTTAISTDNNGYYYYGSLATGQYNISASDSNGYGVTMTNNFQFLNGTLNRDIKLSAIPSFSLTFAAYHNTGSVNDSLVINCAADPQPRSCIIFVNKTASVSSAETNYLLSYVKAIPANAVKVTSIISAQELYNAGFVSGDSVYYAVYSASVNDQSVYEDQATGKNVYNAVSNPQFSATVVP